MEDLIDFFGKLNKNSTNVFAKILAINIKNI